MLYDIFQLAHVTRKSILHEQVQRLRGKAANIFRKGRIGLGNKMMDKQRNIIFTLFKAGQSNGNYIQTIIEILAKLSTGDTIFQIPVGGGNNADIQINGTGAADPEYLSFLENVQKLYLHGQRHLTDFIKQNCTAGGRFQQTDLSAHRTGKGPLFMAEQFTADKVFGKTTAVEIDKGRLGVSTEFMDSASR